MDKKVEQKKKASDEAAYLAEQEAEALVAIKRTAAMLLSTAKGSFDLNAWVRSYPFPSILAGFAGGTALGAAVAPAVSTGNSNDAREAPRRGSYAAPSFQSKAAGRPTQERYEARHEHAALKEQIKEQRKEGWKDKLFAALAPTLAALAGSLTSSVKAAVEAKVREIVNAPPGAGGTESGDTSSSSSQSISRPQRRNTGPSVRSGSSSHSAGADLYQGS